MSRGKRTAGAYLIRLRNTRTSGLGSARLQYMAAPTCPAANASFVQPPFGEVPPLPVHAAKIGTPHSFEEHIRPGVLFVVFAAYMAQEARQYGKAFRPRWVALLVSLWVVGQCLDVQAQGAELDSMRMVAYVLRAAGTLQWALFGDVFAQMTFWTIAHKWPKYRSRLGGLSAFHHILVLVFIDSGIREVTGTCTAGGADAASSSVSGVSGPSATTSSLCLALMREKALIILAFLLSETSSVLFHLGSFYPKGHCCSDVLKALFVCVFAMVRLLPMPLLVLWIYRLGLADPTLLVLSSTLCVLQYVWASQMALGVLRGRWGHTEKKKTARVRKALRPGGYGR